jgi:hypothetical protein
LGSLKWKFKWQKILNQWKLNDGPSVILHYYSCQPSQCYVSATIRSSRKTCNSCFSHCSTWERSWHKIIY